MLSLCQEAFTNSLIPVTIPQLNTEDTEIFLTQQRMRQLGNVRFIGELYKQGVVSISTILNISRELIDGRLMYGKVEVGDLVLDESRLESVNTLLETVQGRFRASIKVKEVVGLIFHTLEGIVKERPDVSMKVKFRLMVSTRQNLLEEQKKLEAAGEQG